MYDKAYELIMEKWKRLKEDARKHQCLLKPGIIMFAVYAFGISAILRANINYRDDLRRVLDGNKGWDNFGRYLSNYLSSFVHGNNYLADVSPLPQLLAALIMAIAAAVIWYTVSETKKFSAWDMAALVLLGLSPYFIQCFSYKYDSPYMALSVLASMLPIFFWKYGNWMYLTSAVVGTLIMCLTYQASSGLFPMLVLFVCLRRWNAGEKFWETAKFALYSAGGYIVGMVLYKVFLMPENNTYVSTSLPGIRSMIPLVIKNFAYYFKTINEDLNMGWLILMMLLCIGFLFVMVRDTKRKWYTAFLVSVLVLLLMLACSFGVYPLLSKPSFQPRAMYGVGVFLTFLAISVSSAKKIYPAKIVCFVLAWCFFTFSLTYGNALREQDDYAEFRITAMIYDLSSLDIMLTDEKKEMELVGKIGYCPTLKNMSKHYGIIKRLVPMGFSERGKGARPEGWKYFEYRGLKKTKLIWAEKSGKDFTKYDLPVLKDTMYHTIRGADGHVLVELK